MKILIAEDDLISCRILEKNIQNWGYDVILAKSSEEAWQALKNEDLRMTILDWMMPGMNGSKSAKKCAIEKGTNTHTSFC